MSSMLEGVIGVYHNGRAGGYSREQQEYQVVRQQDRQIYELNLQSDLMISTSRKF